MEVILDMFGETQALIYYKADLDELVADGTITQEKADQKWKKKLDDKIDPLDKVRRHYTGG